MVTAGRKLFASIHRKKHLANPNHDVHLMARNINDWLSEGVQSIINGTYTPRFLKRYYFKDEMIDQLHLSDRILQNLLLKQLKPTFPHVMSPNCYHLHGPSGVKLATQRIKNGIVLRGPLSQFFSVLYLKPLDDTFDTMDVTYLRYQDDILILCQTKRQFRALQTAAYGCFTGKTSAIITQENTHRQY